MEESFNSDTNIEDETGFSEQTLHSIGVLEDGEHISDMEGEDDDCPIIYGQNNKESDQSDEDLESESDYEETGRNKKLDDLQYLRTCLLFTPKALCAVDIEKTGNLLEQIASNPFFPYDNKVTKQLTDLVSEILTQLIA
jgi:hypothetical protein